MKADDYSLIDLGIMEKGAFTKQGFPIGWNFYPDSIGEEVPRFLKDQPVFTLDGLNVYVRGLYHESLSKERREAMTKEAMQAVLDSERK